MSEHNKKPNWSTVKWTSFQFNYFYLISQIHTVQLIQGQGIYIRHFNVVTSAFNINWCCLSVQEGSFRYLKFLLPDNLWEFWCKHFTSSLGQNIAQMCVLSLTHFSYSGLGWNFLEIILCFGNRKSSWKYIVMKRQKTVQFCKKQNLQLILRFSLIQDINLWGWTFKPFLCNRPN